MSSDIQFKIVGNNFTDSDAILSLLEDIPDNIDKEKTNDIIKILNQSNLFSDVKVRFEDKTYFIIVKRIQNIDNLYFNKNERLEDDELLLVASEIGFSNNNPSSIKLFIDELKKVYESFGYNNVIIEYTEKIYEDTNTIDLYFNINEGSITKINKFVINGNNKISAQEILGVISSKTKSFRNIFANNSYKPNVIDRDEYLILEYYKNNGFLDVKLRLKLNI